MLEANSKNNTRMMDGEYKIDLQESEKLLEFEKPQNSLMCIEFNNLYCSARKDKGTEETILHNVSGHFESGKVTMIIGPSGAGKTTLLKAISGRQVMDIKGTLTVNGIEWNKPTFRKQMCYTSQQFHLLPFLTVRETLNIATRLKDDINKNAQEINLVVNDIAEKLSLSNCLDTLANKLSGGEQKRLSIGVEMVTKSSIILLDEPTSGLDSAASYQIINILHKMARANCTIVCTIHQPSSHIVSLVDDIMVLHEGKCMYCGPKSEILNTYNIAGFTCPNFYNVTEFVLEVVTGQRGGDLEHLYQICYDEYKKFKSRSEYNKNNKKSISSIDFKQKLERNNIDALTNNKTQKKSTWQQQKILFARALICIKRDNTFTKLRIATHIVVAIIFGLIFYDFGENGEKVISNISSLFLIPVFLILMNALQTVLIIPTEIAVFLQERLNNWYSLKSYYSVKVLADLPMQVLCTSCFIFISYYMTGQLIELDRILKTCLICLLCTIIGQTEGIFLGTLFGSKLAVFLVPAINIPSLLLTGYFVKIQEMLNFVKPLSALSYYRFAFEGLMQAAYIDRPNLSCSDMYCYLGSTKKILYLMDIPSISFYGIVIILSCWIIAFHIVICTILLWKIKYVKN
ncbi:ATP-binding cassette sub-family G member 1-like [Solenopsis invicta]|uniref:ATP-binding cassette sub-family G member 1-like n=1 Tax=Solenopsis invicta TaxID=13686 RepID=UPI00193C8F45|nr:ATP-binding cassette sub-family G member 1-like [Solenopsis invicta]